MRFVTELDLRDLYRKEPFTDYDIGPGIRLTPGARQFLLDYGIKILQRDTCEKACISTVVEKKLNWKEKKFRSKMKSIEALFLFTARQALNRDVLLGEKIINLERQFSNIRTVLEGKGVVEDLECNQCTGINVDNFCEDLGDCFEITDFHIQLERGEDIIVLHNLRCALYEVEPAILELYDEDEIQDKLCRDLILKVNQIINCLSQLICCVLGGKVCQRKS